MVYLTKNFMKKSSSKIFGYLFFIIFLILGLWPLKNSQNINFWLVGIGLVFLFLTIINSRIIDFLNKYWIEFGNILGRLISPIVLMTIFFLFMTPLSALIKLFKKDILGLKKNKSKSYWLKRAKNLGSMDKQY